MTLQIGNKNRKFLLAFGISLFGFNHSDKLGGINGKVDLK